MLKFLDKVSISLYIYICMNWFKDQIDTLHVGRY